jgi:hypothetical protein
MTKYILIALSVAIVPFANAAQSDDVARIQSLMDSFVGRYTYSYKEFSGSDNDNKIQTQKISSIFPAFVKTSSSRYVTPSPFFLNLPQEILFQNGKVQLQMRDCLLDAEAIGNAVVAKNQHCPLIDWGFKSLGIVEFKIEFFPETKTIITRLEIETVFTDDNKRYRGYQLAAFIRTE